MPLDLNAAREYFANVISEKFPSSTVVFKEGAVPNATAFIFSWWLPDENRKSREVAALIRAAAMEGFMNASAEVRGHMSGRFEYIIRTRLADGGYVLQDQSPESFKAHIDDLT
ncbi:MAG TPA: hypothetical protein VJT81_09890 [Burkholderiales bacterium]|nr:hypothetical protein [Burkholderiales bacterium]